MMPKISCLPPILSLFGSLLVTQTSEAARAPSNVKKNFEFSSEIAKDFASTLGFDPTKSIELKLPAHLYMGSVRTEILIKYMPKPTPKMIFQGEWMDASTTRNSRPVPRYFVSERIASSFSESHPWAKILLHLGVSKKLIQPEKLHSLLVKRSNSQKQGPLLELVVHQQVSPGSSKEYDYEVILGVDERSPEERKKAEDAYQPPSEAFE